MGTLRHDALKALQGVHCSRGPRCPRGHGGRRGRDLKSFRPLLRRLDGVQKMFWEMLKI